MNEHETLVQRDRVDEVWSVWLHGSVAAVHDAGRLVLLVPVAILTPAVVALALRLHAVGSVRVLDDQDQVA
jgi:hypothetical protein